MREALIKRFYAFSTEPLEEYTAQRTQIIQGDGLWIVEQDPVIGELTMKKEDFEIKGLDSRLVQSFRFKLPKVPHNYFAMALSFFRRICDQMNQAEAYVCIYWDKEKEEYLIDVPVHAVSKGGVRYERDIEKELNPNLVLALEIHSHNTMPGYFSPTDTADEKAMRLYGVIGRVNRKLPEWALRVVSRETGEEFRLHMSDVFTVDHETVESLQEIPTVDFPEEWINNVKEVVRAPKPSRPFQAPPQLEGAFVVPDPRHGMVQFDLWGEERSFPHSPITPPEDERIERIKTIFGSDEFSKWGEYGLSKEDKERLWSFGEDPEWVEEYFYGIDPYEYTNYVNPKDIASSLTEMLDDEEITVMTRELIAEGLRDAVEAALDEA